MWCSGFYRTYPPPPATCTHQATNQLTHPPASTHPTLLHAGINFCDYFYSRIPGLDMATQYMPATMTWGGGDHHGGRPPQRDANHLHHLGLFRPRPAPWL